METAEIKNVNNWTLQFGDLLESTFQVELRQFIPYYENIWAAFIGNNGDNEMVVINGFSKDLDSLRKRFSEHHYTIAESILCINQSIIDMDELSINYNATNALKFQNLFLAYFAHIGRIYDNLKLCVWDIGILSGKLKDEQYKDKDYDKIPYVTHHINQLEQYYYQRHIVIHGKKVPLGKSVEGYMMMPVLRIDKNSPEGWDKSLSWKDFENPVDLIKQLIDTFSSFCKEVNNVLSSIYDDLMQFMKTNNCKIDAPAPNAVISDNKTEVYGKIVPTGFPNSSGVTVIDDNSGYSGYSDRNGSSGFAGKS